MGAVMKAVRFCFYFASIFILFLLIVFAIGADMSYMEMHDTVKNAITNRFSTLPNEEFFDRVYFDYLRLTGRRHFNGVTFLNDGRFMFDTQNSNLFLQERARSIIGLSGYLEKNGVPFLFVRTPSKIKDNSVIPRAFADNPIIENGETLMRLLKESNVDVLDLREKMNNAGFDYYNAFFNGDHHWTAETSLWALGQIGERVNRDYGFDIGGMSWDPGSYQHITYKQVFLGEESIAANALHNFEDVTFLIPKFETDITVTDLWVERMGVVASGNFADVFTPKVNSGDNESFDYADFNSFFRYFFRYENTAAPEQKKVLLIADSMGIPLATYFAATFETVDFMYLVYRQNDRIWQMIDENDYDFAVFILSDMSISFEDAEHFEYDRFYFSPPPG